ncbi:MAG TPA: glycosyltransferase family 4 protein [Candidatus Rubrimentiphilum sp.]|nr:glycosyltransferase family 4 protein [Candidatus Rubrimentiphilum sp.]
MDRSLLPPKSVAVISPYPHSDAGPDLSGPGDSALNWYTRRLSRSLYEGGRDVTIISSCHRGDTQEWNDKGVRVQPTFVRGRLSAAFKIFSGVLKSRARVVHLQHELFAYGGIFSALMIPFCVAGLRLMRRSVVTTVHGVIPLEKIDRDFVRSNQVAGGVLPAAIVRLVWKSLLRLVCNFSDVVHVHEEQHRLNLIKQYNVRSPILVIPIGIELQNSALGKADARRTFGFSADDEVLLFFGYFAAYKGISQLLEALVPALESRPRLKVILAGGINSRLKSPVELDNVLRRHNLDAKRVLRLGFVPDSLISAVFSAADALILPYTMSMSSSGPMSIGLSYKIPILPSSAFSEYLPAFPGMFKPIPSDIAEAIREFFGNRELRSAIELRCEELRTARAWPNVASQVNAIYASF